jgi:hypothetical protein
VNSEDYFKRNLQRFQKKMLELQNKYPSLGSTLNIDRDPHIEHMINAFALISSDLQYRQEKKINQESESIVYNFPSSRFNISPPIGVLKLNADEDYNIPKGSVVNCGGSIFKSLYDHHISKVEIQEVKKEGKNIKITFSKFSKDMRRIDLYCEFNVLNKIFMLSNVVDIVVLNREQYKTHAQCVLKADLNLKNLLHFRESQCFISIEDLILQGTGNLFSVLIPCEDIDHVDITSFETNCVFIENRYQNYTSSFLMKKPGEHLILLENNDSLITVKKVFDEEKEVQHLSKDNKGWYLLKDGESYLIYLSIANGPIYCEVECFSKNLNYNLLPFFEEFVPAKVKWFLKACDSTEYNGIDGTVKTMKLFYEETSVEDYVYTLIDFVNLDKENIKLISVEVIDSVKPQFIGNHIVSQVGKIVSIECETKDYILLKSLVKDIQEKYEHFIDFIFHVGNYRIFAEEKFVKP